MLKLVILRTTLNIFNNNSTMLESASLEFRNPKLLQLPMGQRYQLPKSSRYNCQRDDIKRATSAGLKASRLVSLARDEPC